MGVGEVFSVLLEAKVIGGRFVEALDVALKYVTGKFGSEVNISAEAEKNIRVKVSRIVPKIRQKWKLHKRIETRFRSNEEGLLSV